MSLATSCPSRGRMIVRQRAGAERLAQRLARGRRLAAVPGPERQQEAELGIDGAVQQQAPIATRTLPFPHTHREARMQVEPVAVDVDRLEQPLELVLEVVLVAQQDPVRPPELL